ncbi:hypothetical protein BLA29_008694 [Euroglyphus maynei]|uniref:Uncharacterized protein n=1 Tax=Euroglyphus maynei TaxID=6958 RepID=A0A1Y3BTB3_EURMA|nr:hypothetical protein BLA29_008694 [Euroglyphus maynei]
MTPVKPKGRGRRPRQQVQIMDDSNNRILTRSAVKNKINNEEKVDKSTKNKKQSTGNKRRRKVDKDEIGLLVDDVNSEDDESKVDIEKIRELAETNVANQSNVDQFQKRSRRSRKQSSTTDDHRLQDFMELDDDQLIDAMDETPITGKRTTTSKTKNATRKRKTTTIVNDSSTTKQRTNKTSKSNDNPEDYDENSFAEQENRKNVANCPKDQKKCRITLPEVDFSMRLECNDSREPKSKGVVTRSRAKRIK